MCHTLIINPTMKILWTYLNYYDGTQLHSTVSIAYNFSLMAWLSFAFCVYIWLKNKLTVFLRIYKMSDFAFAVASLIISNDKLC